MNCETFQEIIHELADYRPMIASIRDAGASHLALCAACAAKLASARAIGNGLVLAASAESETAPIRIKENLLAAFAELKQSNSTTAQVVDISNHRLRWWTAAAVAVAAAILVAVILPIWRGASAPDSKPAGELNAGMVEPSRTPGVIDKEPLHLTENEKPVKTATHDRPQMFRQSKHVAAPAKRSLQTVAQNAREYLPLTYLAESTAIDSGTIVRVELSRSALASLGLAMNLEGSGASVKAEVVMGDDGVARAIRLVQ